MKTNLNFCYPCARGLSPACVCYLVGGSVSHCPQGYRLVESARLPVEFLPSLGLSILPQLLLKHLQGPSVVHFGFLHLFQSAAG